MSFYRSKTFTDKPLQSVNASPPTIATERGLCYGAIFTLMPAATADFYGTKNMGMNYGILFTGFGVAGVVGSLLGGKVKLLFGKYDRAYLTVAALLVLSALLATVIRAPKSHGRSGDK